MIPPPATQKAQTSEFFFSVVPLVFEDAFMTKLDIYRSDLVAPLPVDQSMLATSCHACCHRPKSSCGLRLLPVSVLSVQFGFGFGFASVFSICYQTGSVQWRFRFRMVSILSGSSCFPFGRFGASVPSGSHHWIQPNCVFSCWLFQTHAKSKHKSIQCTPVLP